MLASPMVPLAAMGLVDGVGGILWKAGKQLHGTSGKAHRKEASKTVMWVGRGAFLCLLTLAVANQALVSNNYSLTGAQLRPSITMEEYNALKEFQENFGNVYVFGGDADFYYWPDAVGLKGGIQSGGVMQKLSPVLMATSEQGNAMPLAVEWYKEQKQVNEKIYALSDIGGSGIPQILENEDLFVPAFSHQLLRGYALNENFTPPENYFTGPPGPTTFSLDAEFQPPQPPQPTHPDNHPPQQNQSQSPSGESTALKVLLAPVYVLPDVARLVVGVPLTILMWVFLPCLALEGLRRIISKKELEVLRKVVIILGVIVLALVVVLLIPHYGLL
jgi:hypothetical protein